MSATVTTIRPPAVVPLPTVVREKIADFLEAGNTGQIVLDIKEGRVLAYKLTESGRVSATELDNTPRLHHDLMK
jgi:hypothetical protein